MSPEAVSY